MRLRRRRDQEEADQDQAKILKVYYYFNIFLYYKENGEGGMTFHTM